MRRHLVARKRHLQEPVTLNINVVLAESCVHVFEEVEPYQWILFEYSLLCLQNLLLEYGLIK